MAVYIVIVDIGADTVRENLQKHYGDDHYEYHKKNDVFFVHSSEVVDKVSRNLGITSDNDLNGVAGVVLKMNSAYTGFTEREFWNWLSEYGF